MENIVWSPYEDSLLQLLKQHRKISRWTDIAQALATQFQIKGRNGKMCRQRYSLLYQRYQQVFESNSETSTWTFDDEKYLFKLHNELGNKWAVISRKMNGRLRKGLKKMNKDVEESLGKRFKQIKFNVVFKIIEASEDGFKNNFFCEVDTSKRCFGNFDLILEIKNKLIALSYDQEEQHDIQPQNIDCVGLYEEINNFNKNYKRKPKKFRRIPTKFYNLKQRQSSQELGKPKSTHNVISEQSQNEQESMEEERSEKQPKVEKQLSIDNEPLFGEYQQEFYKIESEMKNGKKRRESAQTTGIQQVLVGSGIMEQEPNLPMLGLKRRGTSYLSLLSEQFEKENFFGNFMINAVDECDFNSESFMLKDLMSIKRLSHTESGLFD